MRIHGLRLMLMATVLVLTSCASAGRRDASLTAGQARLLEGRDAKSWTQVKTRAGGPTPIELALANSRMRARPYVPVRRHPRPPAPSMNERKQEGEVGKPKDTGPGQDPISVHFRGTPLGEAIDLLALPLGLNLIIPPNLSQPVTVNFPAIKPRDAIDAILAHHGQELYQSHGVWRIRPAEVDTEMVTETLLVRSGQSLDQAQLKSFLTAKGKLQVDGSGTTLVVTDEPGAIKRMKGFLDIMDQRKPQVLIEALIMEVQHDNGFGLGMISSFENIQFGQFEANLVSGLPLSASNMGTEPFLLDVFSDDWESVLQLTARENVSYVNVLSNPLLTTISGKEAKLEVIEKIPYVEATQQITVDGGGSQSSAQEITFADVGVRLKVTPQVGGDDVIEMQVEPEVLELVDFVLGTPVIDERKVATTVYVRNNETIVLAGLLREGVSKTTEQVPFLGDIPLIGNLFKRREERTEKRELLIFLTPHLISPGTAPLKGFQPQQHFLDQMRLFPDIDEHLTKKSLGR